MALRPVHRGAPRHCQYQCVSTALTDCVDRALCGYHTLPFRVCGEAGIGRYLRIGACVFDVDRDKAARC